MFPTRQTSPHLTISGPLCPQPLYFHVTLHTFTPRFLPPSPQPRPHNSNIELQADTQSDAFLRSRYPNHLSLHLLNTTPTSSKPNRLYRLITIIHEYNNKLIIITF